MAEENNQSNKKKQQEEIKKKTGPKEKIQQIASKGKNKVSNNISSKVKNSKINQRVQRVTQAAKRMKVLATKTAKTAKSAAFTTVKIVTSPFFWAGLFAVALLIIANGIGVTVGQNNYETTCGAFSAPQFTTTSVSDEKARGRLIMGHFVNDGMTAEQASQLAAYIMQSSKGDSKNELKDSDCNNNCIISSNKSGIGLIPFSNADLKALGEFAKKGNADWRDSSTQLRFISNKIKNSKNAKNFKEDPSLSNIDKILGVSFNGNKSKLKSSAKDLNKTYKNEGTECQAIGLGERKNHWSPTSKGPDSTGAANVNMSSLVDFAWSYASDTKIQTFGAFKSSNPYPPAVSAMRLAHQVTPDPAGDILASCDRGVAIAMVATKTDPKYPYGAVEEQYRYMKSNSKYQKVSCGERKPGDIMIWWYEGQSNSRASHTTLYVGQRPGKDGEWMVEASYLDYEPMKSRWNFGSGSSCGVHRNSSYIVEYWRCVGCKGN